MPEFLKSYSSSTRVLAVLAACALFGWGLYSCLTRPHRNAPAATAARQDTPKPAEPKRTEVGVAVALTKLEDLPALPQTASGPNRWDLIEGLSAAGAPGASPATGQPVLRLTALTSEGRHAISARFTDRAPDAVYRATIWVKASPVNNIMMEARDSVVDGTGKPSNYGVARFDMTARAVINASGDFVGQGIERGPDDWVKVWADVLSKDGQIYVLLGMLESPNNLHVFKGAGQELILGGFEIAPRP